MDTKSHKRRTCILVEVNSLSRYFKGSEKLKKKMKTFIKMFSFTFAVPDIVSEILLKSCLKLNDIVICLKYLKT